MPFVSPAPLSACTLAGSRNAKPQPAAMSCSIAGGSLPGGGGGSGFPPNPVIGSVPSACFSVPPLNMIISGTRSQRGCAWRDDDQADIDIDRRIRRVVDVSTRADGRSPDVRRECRSRSR